MVGESVKNVDTVKNKDYPVIMTSFRYVEKYSHCNITCSHAIYNLFWTSKDTYACDNICIGGRNIV